MTDESQEDEWRFLNDFPDDAQFARVLNITERAEKPEGDWLEQWYDSAVPMEGQVDVHNLEWYTNALMKSGAKETKIEPAIYYFHHQNGIITLELFESKRYLGFKGEVDGAKFKKMIYN